METKYFPDKISMLKELDKRVEGLDVNKSAFIPFFGFATEEGETYLCPSTNSFVESFNKVFGDTVSLKGTQFVGNSAKIVSFLDKEDGEEEMVESPSETSSEDLEEEIEVVEEDSSPTFDLAYAESLQEGKSKKEAKIALEEYGREFNIELPRNITFEDMLSLLEEKLEEDK